MVARAAMEQRKHDAFAAGRRMTAFGDLGQPAGGEALGLYSGNANLALARKIARYLGAELGQSEVFEFANENIFVRIVDNVREKDVFLVQPTCKPVQTSIMELLIMIDAFKRASAGRITAVVPYYAYGRSDKKDQPRVPITARLMADVIGVAGASRFLVLDLHAGQIQGFFDIPGDELTARHILVDYFRGKSITNGVVVAPDIGASRRARNFAEELDLPLAIIEKRRHMDGHGTRQLNLIGNVQGCNAIIFDDEIDTGGTIANASEFVRQRGALDVYACATHALLSPPRGVENMKAARLRELVVTNTVYISPEKRQALQPFLRVLSVADLLAEVIRRIHLGISVGEMFNE